MIEGKELKYNYLLQRKKGREWEDMCMGNDLKALKSLIPKKSTKSNYRIVEKKNV
jgi:hypothetical protein